MDLPDCPPGAEGYQDSVTEVPKKPEDNNACTKAEQEFQEHLNSLKIKLEDDSYRCMVERRGRDISGKWIYLCYPCAAVCSGEAILQTHISGKKHKAKLSMRTVWPMSIFTNHPYNQNENANKIAATPKVLKKMAEEVEMFRQDVSEMGKKYGRLRDVRSHIQDILDGVMAPLIGVEYLVEHPPEEEHHEPSYMCTLCNKQGHPRTIVNHMTCFWHRHNYLLRHFPRAADKLKPFRQQLRYRDGVGFIMNRIAHRIVAKYGRMNPIVIDREDYEKDKERIHQWMFKSPHFAETDDCTFEEVVDADLINTINKSGTQKVSLKDPSPPTVAAPKPHNANRGAAARRGRLVSVESLSDLSDDLDAVARASPKGDRYKSGVGGRSGQAQRRFDPYADRARDAGGQRGKSDAQAKTSDFTKSTRQPNYSYKLQMASERRLALEEAAAKSIAYHEKNPEKHPLYPDEWKKFWNRRYKEIQAEGKDPSKHDFKPEWIVFWTGRMKELHKEELRSQVNEIYRRLCLTPPPAHAPPPDAPATRRRSPERRDWKRSPEPARRRSPLSFRSDAARRVPERRRSPAHFRRDRRSPLGAHGRVAPRRYSPARAAVRLRSRSPVHSRDSPTRTNFVQESRGSRSPLSRRDIAHRNRSPVPRNRSPGSRNRSPTSRRRTPTSRNRTPTSRNRSPAPRKRSPSFSHTELKRHSSSRNRSIESSGLQTVLISDDELKPDDSSPWRSGESLDSLGSLPDARSPPLPPRNAPPDDVVATLRSLVALEDYLGSLGPRVVDLLGEAIKMEKEKANSSEELLERESATVLIETAKEKLKGAAQAGLVASAAAAAVRAAVVRAAATLHEADKRARQKKAENSMRPSSSSSSSSAAVPVAGVGAVDRVQIAQQMAAALVAQGKTDVTEEELAQLVDAVVGMAEAKKREANEKKQSANRPPVTRAGPALARIGTASALQLLQSAYDDKKGEREDAPDAMDGLSDSDLETLLKNFNELSAEEQHSLIAYLKKLEAREPQRVERLRQYVSAAAERAPLPANIKPVPIESDDDDYTVEEVFKSATEKVKEDQIRQEMEIVKKSLEESKASEAEVVTAASHVSAEVDLSNNLSSAANLLALVQASLQSANKPHLATPQVADVVSSNTQPRSFGDPPESGTMRSLNAPQPASNAALFQNQKPFERESMLRVAQNLLQNQTPNPHVEPRLGGNNSDVHNAPQFAVKDQMDTDRPFGENNSNMQNESRFTGNSKIQTNQSFAGNIPNTQNELRFPENFNMHTDQSFGGNNRGMRNEPRFGGNSNMHTDQPFGRNIPNIQNEPRFAANSRMYMDQSFGGNDPNTMNESRYDGNSNMHTDQTFGGNNPNVHNESRFGNMHNEQGMGGNAPSAIVPVLHNEQSYGGINTYNEQSTYTGNVVPKWEQRQDMQRDYNNHPQDGGPYNQDMYSNQASYTGNYNNMNSGMQENFDARSQTPMQQFGKFDPGKNRGRGGGGGGRHFGGRGRGRGRGAW